MGEGGASACYPRAPASPVMSRCVPRRSCVPDVSGVPTMDAIMGPGGGQLIVMIKRTSAFAVSRNPNSNATGMHRRFEQKDSEFMCFVFGFLWMISYVENEMEDVFCMETFFEWLKIKI